MTKNMTRLKSFLPSELVFDDEETKDVLKFFFRTDSRFIDQATVSDNLRNLAQRLLIEAIDASAAMSWMEIAFRWSVNPGSGVKKALAKLGRKAATKWFKHYKGTDLVNAKIFMIV